SRYITINNTRSSRVLTRRTSSFSFNRFNNGHNSCPQRSSNSSAFSCHTCFFEPSSLIFNMNTPPASLVLVKLSLRHDVYSFQLPPLIKFGIIDVCFCILFTLPGQLHRALQPSSARRWPVRVSRHREAHPICDRG